MAATSVVNNILICTLLVAAALPAAAALPGAAGCLQCQHQRCDANNNCLGGCMPGFAGRKCLHKCPSNCVDSVCDYDGHTGTYPCSIGCNQGFYGLRCSTPCLSIDEDGKCDRISGTAPDCQGVRYGKNCETSCLPKCVGSVCDNKGQCIIDYCIPGRYGANCNKHCEGEGKRCHKDTGISLESIADTEAPYYSTHSMKGAAEVNGPGLYIAFCINLLVLIASVGFTIFYTKDWVKWIGSQTGNVNKVEMLERELSSAKAFQDKILSQEREVERGYVNKVEVLERELSSAKAFQDKLLSQEREVERGYVKKLERKFWSIKECQDKILSKEKDVERVSGTYRLDTGILEKSYLLVCTNIKFSEKKCNLEKVHIDAEGTLINKSQSNPPHSDQRLKTFWGTSSTVPLPQCGSPQYFEVESRVGIEKTLTGNYLLLEIGLTREEEQDQHYCIDTQPNSYCLTVAHSPIDSSICRMVWRHGTRLTCLSDTLENTPGTSATLHYGVVYDSARSRIAFLDVTNGKIMENIDNVDSSVALWPMFSVHNPHLANVRMSLVVGTDIDMTDKKKSLIRECLS